jgi:hypothetical protein
MMTEPLNDGINVCHANGLLPIMNTNYEIITATSQASDVMFGGIVSTILENSFATTFEFTDNKKSELMKLHYTINRAADIFYSLEILNKINKDFYIQVEFVTGSTTWFSKNLTIDEFNDPIIFDDISILIRNQYNDTNLVIICDKQYFTLLKDLNVKIGYGIANNVLRREMANQENDFKLTCD